MLLSRIINKVKRLYRIILPLDKSSIQYFENDISSFPYLLESGKVNEIYELQFENGLRILMRNKEHSDMDVFKQVFIYKEYEVVSSLVTLNRNSERITIIDAGANVGYTSLYFSSNISNCQIFAIEPCVDNAKILSTNLDLNLVNARVYQNALCEVRGKRFELNRNFRDSKDWSISTNEVETGLVKGITIAEIIKENHLDYISLLKIDIEGAERFIFQKDVNLSFLKITKFIAMEIHDEFQIRNQIYNSLKENGFALFNSGELTIGVNLRFNFT